ncbi:MAG TPA: hypothetical protein VGA37_09590 [Gemmatimonadales bacterium]
MRHTFVPLLAAFVTATTPAAGQSRDAGTLVVVNKGAAAANLIDLASGRIVTTLPTGDGPHEIVITGDGRTAVVTDYGGRGEGGNTLTVIDVPGKRVVRTIALGDYRRPHGAAFLPGDTLLAVTSESSQNVLLVHVGAGTIVKVIPTGQRGSHMLAMIGGGRMIYTSNGGENTVSALDVTAGRATRTLPVPPRPEAITVTRDGREVWVGSNEEGSITVIDTESGTPVTAATGFGWPYRILITPDNARAIIPDLGRHELRVFDRATHRELHKLDLAGTGPQGVTLSADGRTLFLSYSQRDQVAVIDLATMTVVRTLATGDQPDGVVYSPIVLGN